MKKLIGSMAIILCLSCSGGDDSKKDDDSNKDSCVADVEARITEVKATIYDACQKEFFENDDEKNKCIKAGTAYASSPPTEEGKEREEGRVLYILNRYLLECDTK